MTSLILTGSPELRADSMTCNNTRTERDWNSGVSGKLKPKGQDPKRRKVQRGEPNIWHHFFPSRYLKIKPYRTRGGDAIQKAVEKQSSLCDAKFKNGV